jgi:hypothetical protein
MALGVQPFAGLVGRSRGQGIAGSWDHEPVISHSSEETPMRNTMRKWGEEVLLFVAAIAIGVLVIVF